MFLPSKSSIDHDFLHRKGEVLVVLQVVFINLFFVPLLPLYLIYKKKQRPLEPNLELLFQFGIIAVCNVPLTKIFIFLIRKIAGIYISIDSGYYTVAAFLPTVLTILLYELYKTYPSWKKKINIKICFDIIQILFVILMVIIAIATTVLDRIFDSPFPNTVVYSNFVYYLAAAVVLILSLVMYKRIHICGKKDIGDRVYLGIMIGVPLAVWLCWQLPVAKWIYIYMGSDFANVMKAAIGLSNGENFSNFSYFQSFPNNANLAMVLSWIYGIVPNWKAVLLLGATLTNISAVLVAVSVKNVTKSRFISVVSLVLAELLMAMTWRAFLVYTDNYGMIFVALILFVYSLSIKDKYKMPLVMILTAMGTFIKTTIFICLLAIFIHRLFVGFSKNSTLPYMVKKGTTELLLAIVIFGVMFLSQSALRSYYSLDLTGQYHVGWQCMFMVGQNNEAYGATNSMDSKVRKAFIEEAKSLNEDNNYINARCLAEAITRVSSRGLWGNIMFYVKKMNIAYNDGYFHNVQGSSKELEKNILFELLWGRGEPGSLYQVSAGIVQIAWDAVLLCLMASAVLLRKDKSYKLYQIMILGITLYLMLFEVRAKYLYMFLPIYVCAAGISFAECKNQYMRMTNAIVNDDKIDGIREKDS